jgi:DNA-binding beta-propeller fold protein YncE
MHVTGTPGNGNPSPASFAGSGEGTTVTLNLGDYNVSEDFEDSASSPLKVVRSFSTDCSGLIETASEGRECNVTNEFAVKEYLFLSKWGSAGTGDGQFNVPFGVAVNPEMGSVYVADTNNHRTQVFDASGNFITKFEINGAGNGQFSFPFGVAVDPSTGNVYVADTFNNRVQVFDSTGTFITILGSFNTPVDVALKPTTGNIYVTDTGNDRIQVFFLDP